MCGSPNHKATRALPLETTPVSRPSGARPAEGPERTGGRPGCQALPAVQAPTGQPPGEAWTVGGVAGGVGPQPFQTGGSELRPGSAAKTQAQQVDQRLGSTSGQTTRNCKRRGTRRHAEDGPARAGTGRGTAGAQAEPRPAGASAPATEGPQDPGPRTRDRAAAPSHPPSSSAPWLWEWAEGGQA